RRRTAPTRCDIKRRLRRARPHEDSRGVRMQGLSSDSTMHSRLTRWNAIMRMAVALACAFWLGQAIAIAPEITHDLAFGDGDARDKAIAALVASGDARALPLLEAWRSGAARTQGTDGVLLADGDNA